MYKLTNPYINSRTKITKKDTLGQVDLVQKFLHSDVRKMNVVEKFVHSDVRKMNDIADNIQFSRYLLLEQLNYQSSGSLSLYKLCLNSLHYILVFQT